MLCTRIIDASVEFCRQEFVHPLQLSSGAITHITQATSTVRVSAGGREGTGRGSVYLSHLWAWPQGGLTHQSKDAALRALCTRIAADLAELCGEPAHPLELGLRLHASACRAGLTSAERPIPDLAASLCASPFDAAVHDATGRALGLSAFALYDSDTPVPPADAVFARGSACAAVRETLRPFHDTFDAWWIVSAGDDLAATVLPAVHLRGYRAIKLKLLGTDTDADVQRTAEVYRALAPHCPRPPRLTGDSNEANPSAESVLSYLQRLRHVDPEAFAALEYLEQPTSRDIRRHPQDWRMVTALKPVMLDEGLSSLELLGEAASQHWSGIALKTCKGHSFALVAAAWARERGLLVTLQDLTNPGYAAIHSALLAAHVPTVNGLELNSPQYTPGANARWLPELAGLFEPRQGQHHLNALRGRVGLATGP